jgi:hypothetical protein
MTNTLLIHHQDGLCEYGVKNIRLEVSARGLALELEAEENPDCALGSFGAPTLYVEAATVSATSLADLEREYIDVPVGWDTDEASKEDNIFRIYIGEHFALDNNKVAIERIGPGEFRLRWSADAADLNYYDERAKRNRIEVQAAFRTGQ